MKSWHLSLYEKSKFLRSPKGVRQLFLRYGVKFLSWECWDFLIGHDHFWRLPKNSQVFRRILKSSENVRSASPSLIRCINVSLLPVLFTSKIRDREKDMSFFLFYTWFSFLTWVWVNIFLENCVKHDGNNSHFSVRHEKLARRRERLRSKF